MDLPAVVRWGGEWRQGKMGEKWGKSSGIGGDGGVASVAERGGFSAEIGEKTLVFVEFNKNDSPNL